MSGLQVRFALDLASSVDLEQNRACNDPHQAEERVGEEQLNTPNDAAQDRYELHRIAYALLAMMVAITGYWTWRYP